MNDSVITLPQTRHTNTATTIKAESPLGIVGRGYQDGRLAPDHHGVIGDYQCSLQKGEVITDGPYLYLFDADAVAGFANNRVDLSSSIQSEPVVEGNDRGAHLRMSVQFQLRYDSSHFAAELAVVHLLQSQRQLQLASGDSHCLIDHSEPLLYLADSRQTEPYTSIGQQALGQQQHYDLLVEVGEQLPVLLNQQEVSTLTVMEQYQSYFLQREITGDDQSVIWTPLLAPVSWGWSIRVGRRADESWGILRRKLIKPTVGHDGLMLPEWNANLQQHYHAIDSGSSLGH